VAWGWVAIGAFVAVWDRFAPETLTGRSALWCAGPRSRVAWPATVLVTSAHLLGVLPPKLDPFYHIGKVVVRPR
jgi:hypothetical protein